MGLLRLDLLYSDWSEVRWNGWLSFIVFRLIGYCNVRRARNIYLVDVLLVLIGLRSVSRGALGADAQLDVFVQSLRSWISQRFLVFILADAASSRIFLCVSLVTVRSIQLISYCFWGVGLRWVVGHNKCSQELVILRSHKSVHVLKFLALPLCRQYFSHQVLQEGGMRWTPFDAIWQGLAQVSKDELTNWGGGWGSNFKYSCTTY